MSWRERIGQPESHRYPGTCTNVLRRAVTSMFRVVRWVVIVGFTALVVQSLPDLARYLKMRSL